MVAEKRFLQERILTLKKEVLQTQKQTKAARDCGKQVADDIDRLSDLVCLKADKNHQLLKEIALARRDVRNLH